MKNIQLAWHGCCRNLDEALEAGEPRDAMAGVLLRNLYVDEEGEPLVDEEGEAFAEAVTGARWLADYLLAQRAHLQTLPSDDVLKGRISWVPFEGKDGAAA
jgi:hypothetical protein